MVRHRPWIRVTFDDLDSLNDLESGTLWAGIYARILVSSDQQRDQIRSGNPVGAESRTPPSKGADHRALNFWDPYVRR